MHPERPLVELARHFQTVCQGDSARFREKLQTTLEPMIRCALRTGLGQPSLVRWVQDQLPFFGTDEKAAGPLARELSDRLLARLNSPHTRETVVGP